MDVDECAEGRAACSFRCHNTPGSWRCTCPYGYRLAADGAHCRDVDECAAEPAPCPHACENVVGSYICKCPEGMHAPHATLRVGCPWAKVTRCGVSGYRRTAAAHDAADACEDVDECAERRERCAPGVCINTEGGFLCDCDTGYQRSDDGHACIGALPFPSHRYLTFTPFVVCHSMYSCPATRSKDGHVPQVAGVGQVHAGAVAEVHVVDAGAALASHQVSFMPRTNSFYFLPFWSIS